MSGLINVPASVLDPQLKVLLSQLRERAISSDTDRSKITARMAALEDKVAPAEGDPQYATIPQPPSQFRVTGLFQTIILDWAGGTTYLAQRSVAHTEIWRSLTNNRNSAVLRATSVGDVWSDSVENGQGFYYWIRFINTAGVPSEWSGGINGGTYGQTVLRPADVIPVLSGRITTSELALALNSRINLIDAPGTGLVTQVNTLNTTAAGTATQISQLASNVAGHTSSIQTLQTVTGGLSAQWTVKTQVNDLVGGIGFYNNGVTTKFYVNAQQFAIYNGSDPTAIAPFFVQSGQVYINSAMIADAAITSAKIESLGVERLVGDKAAFVTANIADASITSAKIGSLIESTNYVAGSSGWRITKAGNAEFNNGTFRNITATGNITANSLTAGTAMVDTLHVNGNAITTQHFSVSTPVSDIPLSPGLTWQAPVSVTMPTGSSGVILIAALSCGNNSANNLSQANIIITKNGAALQQDNFTIPRESTASYVVTAFDANPTGTNTYAVTVLRPTGVPTPTLWRVSLTAMGGKR